MRRKILSMAAGSGERGPFRRWTVMWAVRMAMFSIAAVAAFLLRFDLTIPAFYQAQLWRALPIWLLVKTIVFQRLKLDLRAWRYVSARDLAHLAAGNAIASLVSAVPIAFILGPAFPRSIYVLDLLACALCTAAVRIMVRILADLDGDRYDPGAVRVVIYGAGAAGILLLKEIRSNAALNLHVTGFIDDDRSKHSLVLYGVRVFGSGAELAAIARQQRVQEVLIAIPSASGSEMVSILRACREAGLNCKTVPSMAERLDGRSTGTPIRDVAVEDLLGRKPVRLEADEIRRAIHGQVILVTGAAGSIGSELCRQIALFRPASIIAYEISETALFYLDREMKQRFPQVNFCAEIGSIQNRRRFTEVLRRHRPVTIFHAAAYKHVPLMETHIVEAVENNILGTYQVVAAAAAEGIPNFVMISSDKAVRPANVMGATKRVAELIVKSFQSNTKCVSVRFGNVLGSSGSVIPIFKQQIASGGPVEVTHPDVKRYFMTIPEAAQLVLQAATMGRGGEIFVLDMGESIRIVDLARSLIALSGFQPEQDIQIAYTGLRPGEKLYEELSTLEEETTSSPHEKIKVFVGSCPPFQDIMSHLRDVQELVAKRDSAGLLLKLKELVPDYNPSLGLLRRFMPAEVDAAATSLSLRNLAIAVSEASVPERHELYSIPSDRGSQNPSDESHGKSWKLSDEDIRGVSISA